MAKKKSKPSKKVSKKAARPIAKSKAKSAAAQRVAAPPKRAPAKRSAGAKLSFNHAMVYAKDVERALGFYRDILGMKMLDEFRFEGKAVYARMQAPGGEDTIALHQAGPGASVASDGVRLYFEIRELDDFCQKLRKRGFVFTQQPQMMPWGWRHAYLNDPEGHEISLYWAGEQRMQKSVMQA